MEQNELIWKVKLLARVHDPAEKAIILLRGGSGHEEGTVRALREMLFPEGIHDEISLQVHRADQWAAAADRPQFPRMPVTDFSAVWPQIRFYKEPVLIHPLSGERIAIPEGFQEIDPEHIKALSIEHFKSLILKNDAGEIDFRKTALAFWRFGIERPAPQLKSLWAFLPADTRVPDHTIWEHLDLTAALAAAFSVDSEKTPAILLMTFGPVQRFIAQSRTTSDLWAGSHLMSRLIWEGLKVICRYLGPESVIFPMLLGIPQVDIWLKNEVGLPGEWFNETAWTKSRSDSNPLFGATFPNRFMAIVPNGLAENLAQEITANVRTWIYEITRTATERLFQRAGKPIPDNHAYCFTQLKEQLKNFPEISWVAVPWSLAAEKSGEIDTSALEESLGLFYKGQGGPPGFLGSKTWDILRKAIGEKNGLFYCPNSGVLYPALYDLSDRMLAASKSVRTFEQLSQDGYRCSLCGESEWLCSDKNELNLSPGQRRHTIWALIAEKHPTWARKGEHLCALCTIKRLWPNLFLEEIAELVGGLNRYVVSTHTMALATSIDAWLSSDSPKSPGTWLLSKVQGQAALPRRLDWQLSNFGREIDCLVRGLPIFLDGLRDRLRSSEPSERKEAEADLEKTEKVLEELFGHRPEAYYGLIQMDGDQMGAWLSGTEERLSIKHKDAWHPTLREYFDQSIHDESVKSYAESFRSASPARHISISEAQSSFALELAPYIIEDCFKGKLIYAGGDDLLAMISIDDLLPAVMMLRMVYSGTSIDDFDREWVRNVLRIPGPLEFKVRNGYVWIKGKGPKSLFRTMGNRATASIGAVVAHHTAPLASVLRLLRHTEQTAKTKGGRNSFSLTIVKRSGAPVELTCPWFIEGDSKSGQATPLLLLIQLAKALSTRSISRRAVYFISEWLKLLPLKDDLDKFGMDDKSYRGLLIQHLSYQFIR